MLAIGQSVCDLYDIEAINATKSTKLNQLHIMHNLIIETSLRDTLIFSEILSDCPGLSNEFEREASNYWVARFDSIEDAEELMNEIEGVISESSNPSIEFWSSIELDHE